MVKFWDSFQVYNRHKHDDPTLYGGTNTNVGSNNTQFLYAREVFDTEVKAVPATVGGSIVTRVPRRKSSVSSVSTTATASSSTNGNIEERGNNNNNTIAEGSEKFTNRTSSFRNPLEGLDEVTKRQISDMSQNDFQSVYNTLKKGEPNNNVNF